jgi:hypothetical protein
MSIIYSYPTSQPTVDDLVIGTSVGDDNATKSFVLGDIVTLINAESGSGTLTGVTISTDAFLTAIGNPTGPAVAYTIGLAATGTPSATTFLRGDNQWVIPTVSAGIGVSSQNVTVTDDVSSFNFLGAGVSTSSDPSGNVQVTIAGAVNAVESIVESNGISVSSATGNVIISNTGIVGLVQGPGISISTTSNGISTIEVTGQTNGTVVSVAAGDGLIVTNNSPTISPILALDYTGVDTYITQPAAAVPLASDLIPFHSVTNNTVNKVTFGDIQASTLSLVDASIATANANVIENETATPPSQSFNSVAPVQRVVTLLDSEYNTLVTNGTTLGNTLYLTTSTAAPQFTKTLAITNNVSGFANGSLTGSQIGATLTGVQNSNWSFTTGVSTTSGYSYTGNAPVTISGIFDSTSTVTSTITGSITADPVPGEVSESLLQIVDSIGDGTGYTITSNSPLSGIQGNSFSTTAFGVTAAADVNYVLSGVSVAYNPTTSYYGNNNTTATISGSVSLITYDVTYSVDVNGITDNSGNGYTLVSGDSFSGLAQGNPGITVNSGSSVTASVQVVPTDGTGSITASVTVNPVTADQNIVLSPTGTINANTGDASMTLANNGIVGPANGYQVEYYADGTPYIIGSAKSGNSGSSVAFSTGFTLNSGYTLITALSAVYSNGSSVTIPGTTAVTLAGEVMATRGQGVYNSTSEVSSNEACQLGNPTETVYLSVGGSNIYAGVTCYTSATGSGVVANGFYKANNNNSWMRITGGSGVVQSTGSC